MQKILFIVLVGLFVLFQYQLRYHQDFEVRQIQVQIEMQKATNAKLTQRNVDMINQILSLKGSKDSIEAKARYELNLIKPNELLLLYPGNTVTLKKNINLGE